MSHQLLLMEFSLICYIINKNYLVLGLILRLGNFILFSSKLPSSYLKGTYVNLTNSTIAGQYSALANLIHSIDDFKFLIVYLGASDSIVTFSSLILSVDLAKQYNSSTNATAFGIDTTRLGNRVYALVTYKSATQVFLQIAANCTCSLYGLA